ncbi:uncharacterized protein LOC112906060 [Agrilus planipennis]|uniref:Uncharacterized protein LOC112906060 n=1 Tax=Agrilus planipennis TaxID=224129 RepID=A0A7F5RHH0_AGRPL|nr:uncharacterized protein LOC112906060 [Agrilus planipennis]
MEPKETPREPVEQAEEENVELKETDSSGPPSPEGASGFGYTVTSIAEDMISKSFSELGLHGAGAVESEVVVSSSPQPQQQQQQITPFRSGILKGISSQISGPPLKKRVHFAESNLETIWGL